MPVNTKSRLLPLATMLLVLLIAVSCTQKPIVRDPIPTVKVSRTDFIRGLLDATATGMINDELKTAILSFVNIYNANQESERMKISDDYKIYYNKNDKCYHILDGDLDVAVNIQGAGVAHAYIEEDDDLSVDDRADGYRALIKAFQSGGYIPESVVADMAKIQAKAYSIGEQGAVDKIGSTLSLIDGGTLVDTGVSYSIPSVTVTMPVVDTSGMYNYGLWLDLNTSLNDQIEIKALEKPEITTPVPLATVGTQPMFTFAPMEHNTLPPLPEVTPIPSSYMTGQYGSGSSGDGNGGGYSGGGGNSDSTSADHRQALTYTSISPEAQAKWDAAKQGIEDSKNIILTPGTPTDYSDRISSHQDIDMNPQSLLNSLPDITVTLSPKTTP